MTTRTTALAITAAIPFAAHADFIPVSQSRHIHADASAWDTPGLGHSLVGTREAPGFGPFIDELTPSITGAAAAHAHTQARQNSSIGTDRLHAIGDISGLATTGSNSTAAASRARSRYFVELDILAPTQVQLSGTLDVTGSDLCSVLIVLGPLGGPAIAQHQVSLGGLLSATVLDTYTLNPGRYTFEVFATLVLNSPPGAGNTLTSAASFETQLLVVPAPASGLAVLGLVAVVAARRRR